jgi:hypothetical protein
LKRSLYHASCEEHAPVMVLSRKKCFTIILWLDDQKCRDRPAILMRAEALKNELPESALDNQPGAFDAMIILIIFEGRMI